MPMAGAVQEKPSLCSTAPLITPGKIESSPESSSALPIISDQEETYLWVLKEDQDTDDLEVYDEDEDTGEGFIPSIEEALPRAGCPDNEGSNDLLSKSHTYRQYEVSVFGLARAGWSREAPNEEPNVPSFLHLPPEASRKILGFLGVSSTYHKLILASKPTHGAVYDLLWNGVATYCPSMLTMSSGEFDKGLGDEAYGANFLARVMRGSQGPIAWRLIEDPSLCKVASTIRGITNAPSGDPSHNALVVKELSKLDIGNSVREVKAHIYAVAIKVHLDDEEFLQRIDEVLNDAKELKRLQETLKISHRRLEAYLRRIKKRKFMLKIGEGLIPGASSFNKYSRKEYHYDGCLRLMNELFKMEEWITDGKDERHQIQKTEEYPSKKILARKVPDDIEVSIIIVPVCECVESYIPEGMDKKWKQWGPKRLQYETILMFAAGGPVNGGEEFDETSSCGNVWIGRGCPHFRNLYAHHDQRSPLKRFPQFFLFTHLF